MMLTFQFEIISKIPFSWTDVDVNREEAEPPRKVTVSVEQKVEEKKDILEGSVGEYFRFSIFLVENIND